MLKFTFGTPKMLLMWLNKIDFNFKMPFKLIYVLILPFIVLNYANASSRCGGIDAHGDTGGAHFEMPLPYDQDVFSFCRIGYPKHCWVSVRPSLGTWAQICKPLVSTWISTFERVCPKSNWNGRPMEGNWEGPGSPLDYKGDPNATNGLASCPHGD